MGIGRNGHQSVRDRSIPCRIEIGRLGVDATRHSRESRTAGKVSVPLQRRLAFPKEEHLVKNLKEFHGPRKADSSRVRNVRGRPASHRSGDSITIRRSDDVVGIVAGRVGEKARPIHPSSPRTTQLRRTSRSAGNGVGLTPSSPSQGKGELGGADERNQPIAIGVHRTRNPGNVHQCAVGEGIRSRINRYGRSRATSRGDGDRTVELPDCWGRNPNGLRISRQGRPEALQPLAGLPSTV